MTKMLQPHPNLHLLTKLKGPTLAHKTQGVYPFFESQRISGCLVVEQIKKAYKILSSSKGGGHRSTGTKDAKPNSATLQFGEVGFQRDVKRKTTSDTSYKVLEGNLSGAILCEEEAVPASCGIRAIWVSPCNRRKHIASHLLDAARRSFCMGVVLERSQLAFSQPTSAGTALASTYTGTSSFLVYKATDSDCQFIPKAYNNFGQVVPFPHIRMSYS